MKTPAKTWEKISATSVHTETSIQKKEWLKISKKTKNAIEKYAKYLKRHLIKGNVNAQETYEKNLICIVTRETQN